MGPDRERCPLNVTSKMRWTMSAASNPNRVTRLARINQVIAGIGKHFANVPEIVLGGTSYTPAALVAVLQKAVADILQASNSKAAWVADVQTQRNTIAEVGPVLRYMKTFVITQFGDTQDSAKKLEDFGYTPRKPRSKDVAVKAEAAAKGKATREARGTKGPKQKASIKGNVETKPSTGGAVTPAPAIKPVS
jgi:hypothetical protein